MAERATGASDLVGALEQRAEELQLDGHDGHQGEQDGDRDDPHGGLDGCLLR
jgi:hypothetical protein